MYTAFKRYDTEGPFKLRKETGEFCQQPNMYATGKIYFMNIR